MHVVESDKGIASSYISNNIIDKRERESVYICLRVHALDSPELVDVGCHQPSRWNFTLNSDSTNFRVRSIRGP